MTWDDITLIAGICATLTGGIASLFYTSTRLRRWRFGQSATHLTISARFESIGELCAMMLFAAGFVLLELVSIAHQIERGASHQRLAFSLVVGALWLLLFGVALGRLSFRWQLRPDPINDGRANGAQA